MPAKFSRNSPSPSRTAGASNLFPTEMISFFMHGFGSSAEIFRNEWVGYGYEVTPNSVFMNGDEDERLTGNRRWFPFSGNDQQLAVSLAQSVRNVEASIISHLRSQGIMQDEPINLIGHSQGGMIALELTCRGPFSIASVQCFASYLPTEFKRTFSSAAIDTTVVLYSSRADRYIMRKQVEQTVQKLRMAGISRVTDRITDILPHQFSAEWLRSANFTEAKNGD